MRQKLGSITLFLIFFMPLRQSAAPGNETVLSARLANCEMAVKLAAQKRLIDGTEILTWKNSTPHPTSELQFHLYYNAWPNEESSQFHSIRRRRSFRLGRFIYWCGLQPGACSTPYKRRCLQPSVLRVNEISN